ncbi:MAG: super-infection exclusion protein B [Desulfosporosinus sp.]|nr:super-infection exclusion protein B [Desulfosporosinus sp.]
MLKTAFDFIHSKAREFRIALMSSTALLFLQSDLEKIFDVDLSNQLFNNILVVIFATSLAALIYDLSEFLQFKYKDIFSWFAKKKETINRLKHLSLKEKWALKRIIDAHNQPTSLSSKDIQIDELIYANIIYKARPLKHISYRFPEWVYRYLKSHPKLLK